tara:strand:- start:6406 stop:8442 length:2037 start_codon:yes stop_codon:yes gene_type:complete
MYKFFLILLFLSTNLFSSDFGITGLIDTPSARSKHDGALKVTFSNQEIANITNITYQATPWLETTFRYTYGFQKDRSYGAKFIISKENGIRPSVAIGAQDILGTGVWGSEYIVASKKINNLDISLGLGWGRLAGDNKIKNPLLVFSDSFDESKVGVKFGGKRGGKVRFGSFFQGSHAGIFGGIKYKIPNTNIKLIAEYNTDTYQREIDKGVISDHSPINYGIEWNSPAGFDVNLNHQQGHTGISFSATLDTKSLPSMREIEPFYSSYDHELINNLSETLNFNSWYDRLLYDFDKSGLLLRNARISPNKVIIEFSNFRHNLSADAINRALTLTQIHIPNEINNIDLIINESGLKVMTISYNRVNADKNFVVNNAYDPLEVRASSNIDNPTNITKFIVPNLNINANLATKFQFFDPDKPAKHQVYLRIESVASITQTWRLIGVYALDIDNNFDLTRGPNSVLDHVRTEVNKYLVNGSSGIDSLYLEKKSNINDEIFYRAYLGILELMYSGYGLEVLYQPFKSRLAVGSTINKVYKRGYERDFELLDYNTTTGFLSLYYASPFYNYDFAIHVGRYLAGDKGATIEMRRTFDNGFSVGAFATFTNVSAEDYGEGSFDKGLYFKIPFDSFLPNNRKTSYSTTIRSLQRDGGQKLDDFTGRLWFDLRTVRYDSFINNKNRMIPK